MKKNNYAALLPIGVFLVIYLGLGILFEYVMKIPMGFYNIPIVVAFLAALLVACLQNRKLSFDEKLALMGKGVGDKNIITMILIFMIAGIFDKNPELVGNKIRSITVQPMLNLEPFIKEHDIDIAVLTIPKEGAVLVFEELMGYGIRAFWNFAHVDLNVPEGILVENVHLSESLMKLSYNLNQTI